MMNFEMNSGNEVPADRRKADSSEKDVSDSEKRMPLLKHGLLEHDLRRLAN